MKRLNRVFVFCLALVMTVSFLGADVYLKKMKKVHAFAMMGKKNPQQTEIEESWFGENRFSVTSKNMRVVGDLQAGHINFIIPKLKSYYRFPVDLDKARLKEMVPPKVYDIITSIKISGVKVQWTGEKKKVANWDCEAVDFEMSFMIPAMGLMPKLKFKTWITRDTPVDIKSATKGLEVFFTRTIAGIIQIDEESKREFEKFNLVNGMGVASEGTIMLFGQQIKIEEQCLEMSEKSPPAGTYSIPKGYVKKKISFPGPNEKK